MTYKSFLDYGDVVLLSLIGHAPSTVDWMAAKDMKGLLNIQNNVINRIIKRNYKEKKKIVLIGHSTGGAFAIMSDMFFSKKYHAMVALTPITKLEVGIYSPLNIPLNVLTKTSEKMLWQYQFDLLQYAVKNYNSVFNYFVPIFGAYKKSPIDSEKKYVEDFSAKILEQNYMALKYYAIFFNDLIHNKRNSLYQKYKDFLNGKITQKNQTLVIGGKDDLLVDVKQQREAAENLKAKYVELENCGHFCTLDSSDRILHEIKVFLNLS